MTLTLLEAIAREEGWNATPVSRCRRNNNPGNIEAGRFAVAHGAVGADGRFAKWATPGEGFAALEALLRTPGYANLTVGEAIIKFAPPSENDTASYIEHVCAWTGAAAVDPIAPLLDVPWIAAI